MHALNLVTGPSQEPVTLEGVKLHARIDYDADDELIVEFISTAREWVEGQTKRALVTQTYDLYLDYGFPTNQDGQPCIRLPVNPVASVSSITYKSESAPSPETTLAASQYIAVTRKYGSYIVPAYNVDWPTPRRVPEAVTVRFVAGESASSVPSGLCTAIKLLATHLYERRDLIMDEALREIPYGVEALISPYRS